MIELIVQPILQPILGAAVGVALGARHALEPDHLAAVSVLAAEAPGARRCLLLGALWGAGHTAALLGVALVAALLAARIPPTLASAFELAVAAMLVAVGGRALLRAVRGAAGAHAGGPARDGRLRPRRPPALRPLLVGTIHGLAGSGALVALVTARLPTTAARCLFIALFGAGSTLGMALASGLAGWPLARLGRHRAAARLLAGTAGMASVAMGAAWGLVHAWRLM